MIQEAQDFRDESNALYELIKELNDEDFSKPTLFKDWTTNRVLGHLHMWNRAAQLSLEDAEGFQAFYGDLMHQMRDGLQMMADAERDFCSGQSGKRLMDTWKRAYEETADAFAVADPKTRVKWAGPDMSARSSITARQMETWAHGQAVFDRFGVERTDGDRIRNIAFLGVNTFGWTFANRGQQVPAEPPRVSLTAPSGAIWEWHGESSAGLIQGSATQFCQVVTQTRNILDTSLDVHGEVAELWMSQAQCFAGPPESPPNPGARGLQNRLD